MSNRKGFTLIELLAIIVVLAIIAVITVPVVLDIIDKSKKNAIMDSSYGYVDSVNKFYFSSSLDNVQNDVDDGIYTVSDLKNMGVSVNGEEPSEGWVQIQDGNVIVYSLKFDDYVVTKNADSEPIIVLNGKLKHIPGTVDVGDLVCYGPEGEEECFKVLKKYTDNGTEKALLFSRYNLKKMIDTTTNIEIYRQDAASPDRIRFSETDYWMDKTIEHHWTVLSSYLKDVNGNTAYYTGEPYPYVYDLNCEVYEYVDGYLDLLKKDSYGLTMIAAGRLFSYEELNDITMFANADERKSGEKYWLGSVYLDGVKFVSENGDFDTAINYNANSIIGVRPVIEVPISNVASHVVEY